MKQGTKTEHLKIGAKGEDIVVKHLMKQGFEIMERNYRKKWGEIDVIAKKNNILHFVEVKTVSYETNFENNLPEENMHFQKQKRMGRAIQTYLAQKFRDEEIDFQIDIAAVYLNPQTEEIK